MGSPTRMIQSSRYDTRPPTFENYWAVSAILDWRRQRTMRVPAESRRAVAMSADLPSVANKRLLGVSDYCESDVVNTYPPYNRDIVVLKVKVIHDAREMPRPLLHKRRR